MRLSQRRPLQRRSGSEGAVSHIPWGTCGFPGAGSSVTMCVCVHPPLVHVSAVGSIQPSPACCLLAMPPITGTALLPAL